MRRWAIVNTLLGLMVALLAFEITRTWARGLVPVATPPSAQAPPPPDLEPHEKGKHGGADKGGARGPQTPAVLVAAIAEKDLFDPSRRPPAPDEVKVEVAPPVTKPPDGVTVVGVRIFGKDREVFVNDTTQGAAATRRLRVGDQVAGYTVKSIEATALALTSPSGDEVSMPLSIEKGKTSPTPGRPPVPGRPPTPGIVSPSAGFQGASPAAGVPVRSPVPPAPVPGAVPQPVPGVQTPPVQPPPGQLPAEARQRLETLRQNEKRSGRRR